jgi:L-arabinokinase
VSPLDPIPQLLERTRGELSADFDLAKPHRVSRAPGRLDVMGGIADYTGSLVCEATLDRAAAVIAQQRADGIVQVFSFNLLDEHKPFTVRMPVDALASATIERVRTDLNDPGRPWAGYLIGCLAILQDEGLIDLRRDLAGGVSLALLSTVPLGAGVSSSAAIEVATMSCLIELLDRREQLDPMTLAAMCQRVENQIVGAPCGIMDQVTSCYGRAGELLKLLCQPHEVQGFAKLPAGVRAIGINSNVKHSVGGGMYGRTRCAAFMAHKIILEKMREIGEHAGRKLLADPMRGYLANLDPEDFKRHFRPYLPEQIKGDEFLRKFGETIDTATTVDRSIDYHVQAAADHHVLEARRVRNFVNYLEEAGAVSDDKQRRLCLDKAGHLMYASHKSYTDKAMLGADECDLLVDLVRRHESAGLYGAKITGGGSGGTVAVLCDATEQADAAIARILTAYETHTGRRPEAFLGTSAGAWWAKVK